MNAYEEHRAAQPGKSVFDTGPTIQEVDQELQDLSEATLERYAAALDSSAIGSKRWEYMDLDQRKAMRAQNELARRQNVKARADAKAAQEAKFEAQQNAANQAKIDDYRKQARGAWIGDSASFDAAWPRLLEQWQIDQVNATMDRTMAEVRARMGSGL
jgi:hypothetical protein